MGTINQTITEIIKEFTHLHNSPTPPPDQKDVFPTMLPAGNAGSIIISRNIEKKILSVGKTIKENEKLDGRFGKADWDNAVRAAFGESLIIINLDDAPTENADLVQKSVKEALCKRETATRGLSEHAFGCTLFNDDKINPFNIGPVRFENRKDWLERKKTANQISTVTCRRVCRAWKGEKLKARKTSKDSIDERSVIDTIKSCRFVCSVETEGLAQHISQEKALMAARIALASIALMWQQPTNALEQFNLVIDGPTHNQASLTFVSSGNQLLASYKISRPPHGLNLKESEWKIEFKKYKNIFSVVNEVLEFYLKPIRQSTRPIMMNSLFHALLWFNEGCREHAMTLAIVKFASALDALAYGKMNKGIQNIIATHLGIKQQEKLFKDNENTMKQIVDRIYNSVRSRTLHGTNTEIGEDLSETRGQAEYLTRRCLLACLKYASLNSTCNDPTLFQGKS